MTSENTESLGPDDLVPCDGKLLWHWRTQEKGFTRDEAAEHIGTSASTIGKVEGGDRRVQFRTARQLADGANLPLSDLVLSSDAEPDGVPSDYMEAGEANGEKIRMLRRSKGYESAEDAARKARIDKQVWSRAERSERIRWSNLKQIAEVLEVSISDISEPAERTVDIVVRDSKGRRL